jgi:hypothetical protein
MSKETNRTGLIVVWSMIGIVSALVGGLSFMIGDSLGEKRVWEHAVTMGYATEDSEGRYSWVPNKIGRETTVEGYNLLEFLMLRDLSEKLKEKKIDDLPPAVMPPIKDET